MIKYIQNEKRCMSDMVYKFSLHHLMIKDAIIGEMGLCSIAHKSPLKANTKL